MDATRAFQVEFPDTPQAVEAVQLEQVLAFESTEALDSSKAWQALLEAYPEHTQLAEIQGRWMANVWREVEEVNTVFSTMRNGWASISSSCIAHLTHLSSAAMNLFQVDADTVKPLVRRRARL